MRAVALNTGTDFHLLDHIAPLASLLDIPLIVNEEKNFHLAKRYYPHVSTEYMPDLDVSLGILAERFDMLFECKYWLPQLKQVFEHVYGKKMQLIFCPHGQSDKGFASPLLAPYAEQDGVLIYGELMMEMLKQLNIWSSIQRYALVGNYRYNHYLAHKKFYDQIAYEEIFSKLKPQKTLLYAPTWKDADQATSFFDHAESIFSQLPDTWNLICKVHPLLEQREPASYYQLESLIEGKNNVLLVNTFPPVYPILAQVDAYLGDYSSVGYDFLSFQRPMFFLKTSAQFFCRLHDCGHVVDTTQNIFQFMENNFNTYAIKQKQLYRLAFGQALVEHSIQKTIFDHFGR